MAARGSQKAHHWAGTLTPRVCALLVALERHRNMGEAAAELGVLQSVLSRQLAGVEKSLGVGLFARTTRSMEPTAEGMVLVREATRFLAGLEKARDEIRAIGEGNSGRIRLGVASVAAAVLAPQAIAAFRRQFPGVAFAIRDDTSDRLLDDLAVGKLDAAVLRIPRAGHFDFAKVELYDEPIRIVARGGHPLAGAPRLDWARLSGFTWILPAASNAARGQIEMLLDRAGVRLAAGSVETLSVPLIVGLLATTDAVAPMADSLARRLVTTEGFSILPIACPLDLEPVSLVWPKGACLAPALENFMAVLVETARGIAGTPAAGAREAGRRGVRAPPPQPQTDRSPRP